MDNQRSVVAHDLLITRLPSDAFYNREQPENDDYYVNSANNICRIRLNKHFGSDIAGRFDIASVLGSFHVEEALAERLRESERYDKVDELMNAARGGSSKISLTRGWLRIHAIRDELPTLPDGELPTQQEVRRHDSKYPKKFRYSAAVAMMQEFGMDFPYCGLPVVLHLGDGSIREILRIMAGIWDSANLTAEDFVNRNNSLAGRSYLVL